MVSLLEATMGELQKTLAELGEINAELISWEDTVYYEVVLAMSVASSLEDGLILFRKSGVCSETIEVDSGFSPPSLPSVSPSFETRSQLLTSIGIGIKAYLRIYSNPKSYPYKPALSPILIDDSGRCNPAKEMLETVLEEATLRFQPTRSMWKAMGDKVPLGIDVVLETYEDLLVNGP